MLPRTYILARGRQDDHCKRMLGIQVVTVKTRVATSHRTTINLVLH